MRRVRGKLMKLVSRPPLLILSPKVAVDAVVIRFDAILLLSAENIGKYVTDPFHEVIDRRSTFSELKPDASQYSSSSTSLSCLSLPLECSGFC